MILSDLIKRVRSSRAWSMQQMADACGVSKQYINKLENGDSANILISSVYSLARGLRVAPELVLRAAAESLASERKITIEQFMKGDISG